MSDSNISPAYATVLMLLVTTVLVVGLFQFTAVLMEDSVEDQKSSGPPISFVGEYDEDTNEFKIYYSGSGGAYGSHQRSYFTDEIVIEYAEQKENWNGETRRDTEIIRHGSTHTVEVSPNNDEVVIYVSHPDFTGTTEIDMTVPR